MNLTLDEADRQLVLMALANLSLTCPGFDNALNLIALQIDNAKDGRAEMFEAFRTLRSDTVPPVHVLEHGRALCGLSGVPSQWPAGHRWVPIGDSQAATCAPCKQVVRGRG